MKDYVVIVDGEPQVMQAANMDACVEKAFVDIVMEGDREGVMAAALKTIISYEEDGGTSIGTEPISDDVILDLVVDDCELPGVDSIDIYEFEERRTIVQSDIDRYIAESTITSYNAQIEARERKEYFRLRKKFMGKVLDKEVLGENTTPDPKKEAPEKKSESTEDGISSLLDFTKLG